MLSTFKKSLTATTIALALTTTAAVAAPPSVDSMQGARRVLVFSSPAADDHLLKTQEQTIAGWRAGARARDVTPVEIVGDRVDGASDTAAALRERYGLSASAFAVVLIGKDGHVAARSSAPILSIDLKRKIDAMPMRQAGQR